MPARGDGADSASVGAEPELSNACVLVLVRHVLKHHTTAFHSISHLTKDIQREEAQPLFLRSVEGL